MRRVKVDLGNRSYEILIGENLAGSIEDFFSGSKFSKIEDFSRIMMDSSVMKFLRERLRNLSKSLKKFILGRLN